MKRAVLGMVIVICLALVVLIQNDWLNFGTRKDDQGKTHIDISADTDKAKKDLKAGGAVVASKAGDVGKAIASKAGEIGEKIKDKVTGGDKATAPAATSPSVTKPGDSINLPTVPAAPNK